MEEYQLEKIYDYIKENNIDAVHSLMTEYNLTIKDGKLFAKDIEYAKTQEQFWDQRQYVIKILLNSLYGTLLNKHCKFFHHDVGQSTTLTGRKVAFHMNSYINKIITGIYDYKGDSIIYADTDSIFKDTVITYRQDSEIKKTTIENLFNITANDQDWVRNDKYYSWSPNIELLHYNLDGTVEFGGFEYIYKHKTNKEKWEIISETGETIIVTEDHSCMVERNGELIEVKPHEILEDDILIIIEGNQT